jgi:hypothetical protein
VGGEQDIAGMSGWRSWRSAHTAHVATVLAPIVADEVARATNTGIRLAAQLVRDHALGETGQVVADFLTARADRVVRKATPTPEENR